MNKDNVRDRSLLLLLLHGTVVATGKSGSYVISDIASKRAGQPCSCEVAVGTGLGHLSFNQWLYKQLLNSLVEWSSETPNIVV